MKANSLYKLGRITGFHGLDGTLKITPYYKGLSFAEIPTLFVEQKLKLTPIETRTYKGFLYLKCKEVTEVRDILKGKEIFTNAEELSSQIDHPLMEDIEDKEFISIDGHSLGTVAEYDYHGGQLTYLLKNGDQELILPAIKDVFIKEITDSQVIVDDSIFR